MNNNKQSTPQKEIVIKTLEDCDYHNNTAQTQPIENNSLYSTLTPKPIQLFTDEQIKQTIDEQTSRDLSYSVKKYKMIKKCNIDIDIVFMYLLLTVSQQNSNTINKNQRFYLQQRKQIIRQQKHSIKGMLNGNEKMSQHFYQEIEYLVKQTYFKNLQIYKQQQHQQNIKQCYEELMGFIKNKLKE